jgi:hypothetical protein
MSVLQTSNTAPASAYDDGSSTIDDPEQQQIEDQQQQQVELEGSSTNQQNSFGNQPQNVTRDQIIQLYRKIQSLNRPNEKEILSTLDDALKNLSDGNGYNDGQSALEYQQVYQEVGGAKLMTEKGGGEDCPNIDTSKDTKPDTKDDSSNVWNYSGYKNGDVSIHAVEGHDCNINVTGTAEIKLSPGQTATVDSDSSSGGYVVNVMDQNQPITKITVSGSVQGLNIDGPPSAVKVNGSDASNKIHIQGTALSQTAQGVSSITGLLDSARKSVSDNLQYSWSSNLNFMDVIFGGHSDMLKSLGDDGLYHYPYVNNFVSGAFNGISQGMSSGNWSGLKSAMDKMVNDIAADPMAKGTDGQWADTNRLNGYHALFMGLYSTLGESKLHAVFNKMASDDPYLFNQFKNSFSALDGKGGTLNPTDSNRNNAPWASGAWSSEVGSWTDSDVKSFIGGGDGSSSKATSAQ